MTKLQLLVDILRVALFRKGVDTIPKVARGVLGLRIKRARNQIKMSIEELATIASVNCDSLIRFEAGEKVFTKSSRERIYHALRLRDLYIQEYQ